MSTKMKTDNLDRVIKNVKQMKGPQNVSLPDLMPARFVAACSEFSSLQALFDASPFKIDSAADFAAIPDADWDAYIAEKTSYPSWEAMQRAAIGEFARAKLTAGLR
nr:hypothetical protein [uncultured Duganella sp.]